LSRARVGQAALTVADVQRDVLRWDYAGAVSGAAMRSGLAFAGRVPAAFRDLRHYTAVFHKLLLEEFRASVQQARRPTLPYPVPTPKRPPSPPEPAPLHRRVPQAAAGGVPRQRAAGAAS